MASITPDSQAPRYQMILDDLIERAQKNIPTGAIWGIPRGGKIVESILCAADPERWEPAASREDADFFVDDIIDSGRTAERHRKGYHKSTFAIIDKMRNEEDAKLPWVQFPWEVESLDAGPEDGVVRLLQFIGEDVTRDGLLDTPKRVVKALGEMTVGYHQDPEKILSKTFEVDHDEMIVLTGIRFTSLCEHHMLPFTGTASVGYIPGKKIVGISKLARLVECFARRLQVQERLTNQVADSIMQHLAPLGVAVIIHAHHECMGCRGVKQPDAKMITSSLRGVLREKPEARAEFMSLSRAGNP